MEVAGPLQPKVPPSFVYQHASAQPMKKDPMKFFEDEPVTARNVQVVEDPPPMYTDKREEKRAKLLENAAKESRERQQKAAEEGRPASRPFTAPKRQAPETPPKADEAPAPENQGSTTNLISQAESPRDAATPPQNMAGMSISDILRMKMAQQAKQKRPRKILAAWSGGVRERLRWERFSIFDPTIYYTVCIICYPVFVVGSSQNFLLVTNILQRQQPGSGVNETYLIIWIFEN